jgi:hypothetical protein
LLLQGLCPPGLIPWSSPKSGFRPRFDLLASYSLHTASFSRYRAAVYLLSYELSVLPYNNSRMADLIFMEFKLELCC